MLSQEDKIRLIHEDRTALLGSTPNQRSQNLWNTAGCPVPVAGSLHTKCGELVPGPLGENTPLLRIVKPVTRLVAISRSVNGPSNCGTVLSMIRAGHGVTATAKIPARRKRPADSRITAKLIEKIKRLISTGVIGPGAKFPPERELAKEFGVNRATLRQALKVLEIMGVLTQRVGDGTYLNAIADSILDEPLDFLIDQEGVVYEHENCRSCQKNGFSKN